MAALQDKEVWVRRAAAESLGRLGVASETVISALVAALQNEEYWVRSAAAESLGSLGVASETVLSALVATLQDKDFLVQGAAAESLGQLKIKDKTQLQRVLIALNRCLHDSNSWVQHNALGAIRELLEGRQIPGYRWRSVADRQNKLLQFNALPFKKLLLIALVSVFLLILGATSWFFGVIVVIAMVVAILYPILFPSK